MMHLMRYGTVAVEEIVYDDKQHIGYLAPGEVLFEKDWVDRAKERNEWEKRLAEIARKPSKKSDAAGS